MKAIMIIMVAGLIALSGIAATKALIVKDSVDSRYSKIEKMIEVN